MDKPTFTLALTEPQARMLQEMTTKAQAPGPLARTLAQLHDAAETAVAYFDANNKPGKD